jgi:hypothetical protein
MTAEVLEVVKIDVGLLGSTDVWSPGPHHGDPDSVSPCGICVRQSDTGINFSPSHSVSPVSIIPPLLHIHPYIIWGIDNGPVNGSFAQRHSLTPRSNKGNTVWTWR